MSYAIKEIFYTLQGEGAHAGTPALFIRFAGCNLWSGRPEDRVRDDQRHEAACPQWCDTDFRDGTRMSVEEILDAAHAELNGALVPLVVFTGGEPLLQLDDELAQAVLLDLHAPVRLAIETNGSIAVADSKVAHTAADVGLWVCVSPKLAPHRVKQRTGDELKVVWPGALAEPEVYRRELGGDAFKHLFVSPLAIADMRTTGRTFLSDQNMVTATQYVLDHPAWRLSLQTHKVLKLR